MYEFTVTVENNSYIETLTNVQCSVNPGNAASVVGGEISQIQTSLSPNTSAELNWAIQINQSNYPAGGIHYFEITVNSDQTDKMIARGSVALTGAFGSNNELNFDTDVWKFDNFTDTPVCSYNYCICISECDINNLLSR